MLKRLTEEQTARYREEGFVFPIRVMDEDRAADYRRLLEEFEAAQGGPVSGALRNKSHLLFRWVDELMRDDAGARRRGGPDR